MTNVVNVLELCILKYNLWKNHKHRAASSAKQIAKKYAEKYTVYANS
jgi:hypothetical protein